MKALPSCLSHPPFGNPKSDQTIQEPTTKDIFIY